MSYFINHHSLLISAITDTELAIFFNWSAKATRNMARKLILAEKAKFTERVKHARSQASAAEYLRPLAFWDVMQPTGVSVQPIAPLKLGPTEWPESSVTSCLPTSRNIPEERGPQSQTF